MSSTEQPNPGRAMTMREIRQALGHNIRPVTAVPPAARLRQAAMVLHEAVATVSRDVLRSWPGPGDVPARYAACVQDSLGGTGGAFAALMHPGVATAIALWLEAEARRVAAAPVHPDWQEDVAPHALTVADTILAGASR